MQIWRKGREELEGQWNLCKKVRYWGITSMFLRSSIVSGKQQAFDKPQNNSLAQARMRKMQVDQLDFKKKEFPNGKH